MAAGAGRQAGFECLSRRHGARRRSKPRRRRITAVPFSWPIASQTTNDQERLRRLMLIERDRAPPSSDSGGGRSCIVPRCRLSRLDLRATSSTAWASLACRTRCSSTGIVWPSTATRTCRSPVAGVWNTTGLLGGDWASTRTGFTANPGVPGNRPSWRAQVGTRLPANRVGQRIRSQPGSPLA